MHVIEVEYESLWRATGWRFDRKSEAEWMAAKMLGNSAFFAGLPIRVRDVGPELPGKERTVAEQWTTNLVSLEQIAEYAIDAFIGRMQDTEPSDSAWIKPNAAETLSCKRLAVMETRKRLEAVELEGRDRAT